MNATLVETLTPCSAKLKIPKHIAIIMDGNRRWAASHEFPAEIGHWQGAEALTNLVRIASAMGVKILTVFAFSTENWNRSPEEIESIMELFHLYLLRQKESMVKEGVKLDAIGDLDVMPAHVKAALNETKEATKDCSTIELVIALNYGGRDDIRRGVLAMINDVEQGLITKKEITENTISKYLDTAKWPDPDLLIRTSGEQRISNFLIWQISYAEIYITDVLWPDFDEKELALAINEYQQRERRLGL